MEPVLVVVIFITSLSLMVMVCFQFSSVWMPWFRPRQQGQVQPQPTPPQPTLPQPTLPQPTLPQPTLLQPTFPQPDQPQPTLPQPTLPQSDLTQPTLPQPDQPQPTLPQPDLTQPTLPQPDQQSLHEPPQPPQLEIIVTGLPEPEPSTPEDYENANSRWSLADVDSESDDCESFIDPEDGCSI